MTGSARRYWRAWALLGGIAAGYAGFYLGFGHNAFASRGSADERLMVGQNLLLHTIGPALVGGPWRYSPLGVVTSIAVSPTLPCVLALVVVAIVVIGSAMLDRSCLRAWALLAAWIAADVALVLYGRIGATLGLEPRDVTDLGVGVALCLGLAFLPLVDSPFQESPWTGSLPGPERDVLRHYLSHLVAGLLGVTAIGAVLSDTSLVAIWQANPARSFIANARHDLAELPATVPLDDAAVPDDVVSPLAYPESRPSLLFRELPRHPAQLSVSPVLTALDSTGHVRLAGIHGPLIVPGPQPDCGWQLGPGPVRIPLDHVLDAGEWVVQLDYVAGSTTRGSVTAGDTTRAVTFTAGHAEVFLAVRGRVDTVDVSAGESVCVATGAVGVPTPITGAGSAGP